MTIKSKGNNQRVFRQLILFFRNKTKGYNQLRKDELWSKIQNTAQQRVIAKKRKQRLLILSSIAASIAILFVANYFINNQQIPPVSSSPMLKALSKIETSDNILLKVSEEKQIELSSDTIVSYSQDGTLTIDSQDIEVESEIEEQYNQLFVPKGKRIQLLLADGSKLWINSGTKIIYPQIFLKNTREIFVEGEIYLDVAHNQDKPFIVNTKDFDVTVLGTHFNICSYDGLESSIVLVEGALKVSDREGNSAHLHPSQRMTVKDATLGRISKVNTDLYTGWINNYLVLEAEPLNNVLKRLNFYYDIDYILEDEKIKEMPLSGKLDLKSDGEAILKLICKTVPIKYKKEGNKYFITSN